MPGNKTYEMKFQLNATTSGSFSSAFSRAQQELSKMQKEIQRLNSIQGEISAYQKQQSAIEATARKLEVLRQKHDNIQREIRETGQFSSDLANKELSAQEAIKKTERKMAEQTDSLNRMGSALREAGVDTNNLTGESRRLEAEMHQLKRSQEDVADSAEQMGNGVAGAMEAAASAIAAAGLVVALKELYEAFNECVTIAADFEATMSTVEALSGAGAQEMEALTAKAKELGATTSFTAQQSGDAMSYMAMAGWGANDMLSGMNGVLRLAAASGEDLAMVSDIVTDNLTAFGLTAADTARFSDVLAAAATNSNTSVSIMGETFKSSASIAGALGYSIEDVAVAVGLMANAGVKGSIAGTALKNTFNGLLEGATLTGSALGDYNFAAIKADGTMKGFKSTMDELRGVFSQMTEAERVQNAQLLAGERGYNGLLAILNATEEDYISLTDAINNCSGAASKMAAIKMDNLRGDITLMQSAWEALKVTVGEEFIPELRNVVKTGTEVLEWLNEFASAHPEAVKAIAAFVAVVGTATVALTGYAAIVKVVSALNLAALFSGPIMPIVALVGGLAALAAGLKAYTDKTKASQGEVYNLTALSRKQYYAVQELNAEYEQAKAQYGETSDEALDLKYQLDSLTDTYQRSKQTVEELSAANQALAESHDQIMASMKEGVTTAQDEGQSLLSLVYKLDELSGKTNLTGVEQQQMLSIVNALNQSIPTLAISYDTVTGSLNKSTDAIRRAVKASADRRIQEEKMEGWIELEKEELILKEQLAEAEHNYAIALQEITDSGYDPEAKLASMAIPSDMLNEYREYKAEVETLRGLWEENQEALAEYNRSQDESSSASKSAESAITTLETALGNLQTAYSEAYVDARESLEGQFSLWEKADSVTATSMSTLQSNLHSQVEYYRNYNANLETVRQAAQNAGIDLSGIWSHLTDGSTEAVASVAGIANAISSSADSGVSSLQAYVNEYQELERVKNQTADTIAFGTESVRSELEQVRAVVESGASDLNMAEQFRQAAVETIQGYIDGFGSESSIGGSLEGMKASISAGIQSLNMSSQASKSGSDTIQGYLQGVSRSVSQISPTMASAGKSAIQGFVLGVQETAPEGTSAMQQSANSAIDAFKSQMGTSTLYSSGRAALQGAVNGINSMIPNLVEAAKRAGQQAAAAYKDAQDINSPSKVFEYFGQMDMLGAIKGIEGMQEKSNKAFAIVATSNIKAYQDAVSAQQNTGEMVARDNDHGINAMEQPTLSDTIIILPQIMEAMAAYKQSIIRTDAEQMQADRMERIIAAIRGDMDSNDRTTPAPIQITFQIQGNPPPETIDRLEDFIYSADFEERVNDVVARAQINAARRRY